MLYNIIERRSYTFKLKKLLEEKLMEKELYRLVIKMRGKWRTGRISYTSKEEAEAKRDYFISTGTKPENIKICTETELFSWEG